jgi:hypothetical protein
MVPDVGDQEQMRIMTLSDEGQHFAASSVFWEGLNEFKRSFRLPPEAEDFWEVPL